MRFIITNLFRTGQKGLIAFEVAVCTTLLFAVLLGFMFKLIIEGNEALNEEDRNRIQYTGKEIWVQPLN